jgi:hypothetical protein
MVSRWEDMEVMVAEGERRRTTTAVIPGAVLDTMVVRTASVARTFAFAFHPFFVSHNAEAGLPDQAAAFAGSSA